VVWPSVMTVALPEEPEPRKTVRRWGDAAMQGSVHRATDTTGSEHVRRRARTRLLTFPSPLLTP
jgi:hypothetical protein